MELRCITQAQVESLGIPISEVMRVVEEGWVLKGQGKVEMPAKIGIHPRKDCYIHAMPCWIGGEVDTCGMKWVSGFPPNLQKHMPYNIGLFVLTDSDDGHMKAVIDANQCVGCGVCAQICPKKAIGEVSL